MRDHSFLFTPGVWLGHGKVTFSTSPDQLQFYTRWNIKVEEQGMICCEQRVEKQGIAEAILNHYRFFDFHDHTFKVYLQNDDIGSVLGVGKVEPTTIAWEFHTVAPNGEGFDGVEIYRKLESGDYSLYAEYFLDAQYRTFIDGRIWKKVEESK